MPGRPWLPDRRGNEKENVRRKSYRAIEYNEAFLPEDGKVGAVQGAVLARTHGQRILKWIDGVEKGPDGLAIANQASSCVPASFARSRPRVPSVFQCGARI